jgi:hypothetical protein
MEGAIFKAIPAIMAEIGSIGKERKNTMQGYSFRGIDDVYNVCQPLMVKHKVFTVPEIVEQTREERATKTGGALIYTVLKIKYTFYCDDGSYVVATVSGEGMDSGDKSSNKAMASAHKYAIIQIFAIPTAEMIDSETENHEMKSKNDQPKQQATNYAAQQKEMLYRFKTLKAENKIPTTEIVAIDALIKYLEGVSPEMDKARWKRARDRFLALKPESEQKEIF